MKIQYFGHSCFRIISDIGTTVVCDPYKSDYVGFEMPSIRSDLVTISHHHDDHDCCDNIADVFAEADSAAAFAADDIAVESFSTFHDDQKGKLRGNNLVFTFVVDGLRIVHMGDIGCLDGSVAERVKGCDVLLIPVGGVYTVDAKGAKWYVDKIRPKIVVPMHYSTKGLKFRLNDLNEFLNLFDEKQINIKNSYSLDLWDEPQNGEPQITVLQRYEE